MSLPPSRDASASPSRSRGGGHGGELSGIDAQVQRIIRNVSDDETRQLEETLAQSRRRHAARLQEELARNRTDSADRLQLEIKVLRAEHAGLLEQKLAEIRQHHYQKVEEELDALRAQSAARLEQVCFHLSGLCSGMSTTASAAHALSVWCGAKFSLDPRANHHAPTFPCLAACGTVSRDLAG